jgi:transcriptional regulator with XRE-family HTH domain
MSPLSLSPVTPAPLPVMNDDPRIESRTEEERNRVLRFVTALNQAMVVNSLSQRKLAAAIGVESGTFTKYLKGRVDPSRIGAAIQWRLAKCLGVSFDALMGYYEDGHYLSGVSASDVESWIRSEAGQEDLPELLQALQEAGQRWVKGQSTRPRPKPCVLTPFEWPYDAIDRLGLPEQLLTRMGVTPEALAALVERGEFTGELVAGFALAMGLAEADVRRAFETRTPIG